MVVGDIGDTDISTLLKQVDASLRTGSKGVVCDFSPDEESSFLSEVLVAAKNVGLDPTNDSLVDVVRWLGNDNASEVRFVSGR